MNVPPAHSVPRRYATYDSKLTPKSVGTLQWLLLVLTSPPLDPHGGSVYVDPVLDVIFGFGGTLTKVDSPPLHQILDLWDL